MERPRGMVVIQPVSGALAAGLPVPGGHLHLLGAGLQLGDPGYPGLIEGEHKLDSKEELKRSQLEGGGWGYQAGRPGSCGSGCVGVAHTPLLLHAPQGGVGAHPRVWGRGSGDAIKFHCSVCFPQFLRSSPRIGFPWLHQFLFTKSV